MLTIHSQQEFDNLPDKFDDFTYIYIKSVPSIKIFVGKARENSSVVAWENSSVEAWENSSVEARGNSSVVARGNSSVEARENSSVEARENSSVVAWENSSVVARGNSSVEARGNSSVVARGNSSVVAWENSSVVARGNSSVEARGNSSVVARENSSVVARENSSVVAWENSSVVAWGNSSVVAWENSSVVAWGNSSVKIFSSYVNLKKVLQESVVICIDCKVKPSKINKTATLLYKRTATWDLNSFLDYYNLNPKRGFVELYKSVRENNTDFYTGQIKYEGIVTCPNWNPDNSIECGYGLHLSAKPEQALNFNKGKILKCKVNIKDIVVYPYNIDKVRCRKVKVINNN